MQDFHDYSMTGGSGDWRMRVQPNNNNHLKCPRCNSLNTKFCYYNNYNHSQPRHFCKNCRRYWTKGGVLRNVPVGGGCRKAKRTSKSKHQPKDGEEKPSSSESSSHTAAVTATATAAAAANADMHDLKWSTFLGQSSSDGGDFSELGGFTSIETTPFGFGNTVPQQYEDRTAEIDPSMGFEPLDWGSGGGDQTLFDLTSTVDHAYWSHQDHNDLYLPQF